MSENSEKCQPNKNIKFTIIVTIKHRIKTQKLTFENLEFTKKLEVVSCHHIKPTLGLSDTYLVCKRLFIRKTANRLIMTY